MRILIKSGKRILIVIGLSGIIALFLIAGKPQDNQKVNYEIIPDNYYYTRGTIGAMGAIIVFFLVREYSAKDKFLNETATNFKLLHEETRLDRIRWDASMTAIKESLAEYKVLITEMKGISIGNRASIERHEIELRNLKNDKGR